MRWMVGVLLVVLPACTASRAEQAGSRASTSAPDSARPWRMPGDEIDSIFPMEEYLRRFREGLSEPGALTGGAGAREELARRFLAAVARRDTAALLGLLVSRAEFAWLVFPDHLYARPPYELDPEIFWLQIRAQSAKGLGRVLERLGGDRLELEGLSCRADTVQVRGDALRIWSPCGLSYRQGGRALSGRLFGSIVERDGRAKFLSYANDF
jgi:hypothetical protein